MKTFYSETIQKDPRFKSILLCKDMALLEPGTRAAVELLIKDAGVIGHELRVFETFRSAARQHYVFSQGRSHLWTVGLHNYGLACDVGLFVHGRYEDSVDAYAFLPELGRRVGLISGYDWGAPDVKHDFIDAGHLQRCPVFRQREIFAGSFYPAEDYNPYADSAEPVRMKRKKGKKHG